MNSKTGRKKSSKYMVFYLTAGLFLGLGAPAGSLLLRSFGRHESEILGWIHQELSHNIWFYVYMAAGTVTAFSLAAFWAARMHQELREKAQELLLKTRELEDKSAKDPMTGLYNFGYIRPRLALEMERSKRFQTPLACLMIDIDDLKKTNDEAGHPGGDMLLKAVAKEIQSEIRLIDTATRYGGDEFFLILPVTNFEGATAVAQRILSRIKAIRVDYHDRILTTTVSIGAAGFPSPGVTEIESLVEAADKALYRAKFSGRNQVNFFGAN